MGRKAAVIDVEMVESYLRAGATVKMVCGFLKISRQTFYKHVRENPSLSAALKYGRDHGDADLALAQFRSAVGKGNVRMLQYLGVNRLGQSYHSYANQQNNQGETDVFTALGVDPNLLDDKDIATLLAIVEKGRIKEDIENK